MSKKLSLRWGVWILIALSVGSTYLNPKITGTFKQISGDPEFEREKKEFLEINLFWWKYLEQLLPASDPKGVRLSCPVNSVSFFPDGSSIVTCDHKLESVTLNTLTGEQSKTFGRNQVLEQIGFSKDGNWAALCTATGELTIRNLNTGEEKSISELDGALVKKLALSPDGQWLAVSLNEKQIAILNLHSNGRVLKAEGHTSPISRIEFTQDGGQLISSDYDSSLCIWNLKLNPITLDKIRVPFSIFSFSISPNGDQVAVCGKNESVHLISLHTGKLEKVLVGHTESVNRVVYSPQGQWLATGSLLEQTIKLWSTSTWEEALTFRGHFNNVFDVSFSPDGEWLVSCGSDQVVGWWKVPQNDLELDQYVKALRVVDFVRSVRFGHQKEVEQTIARYPDIVHFVDTNGVSPLLWAIKEGKTQTASVLLSKKANPNVQEIQSGMTALHYAAKVGDLESVQLLIEYKASIQSKDQFNLTPLEYAKKMKRRNVVRFLQTVMRKNIEKPK
ncbi:MAG TPA: ankyrin repeat domain-containing protein [Acidobacteriota bacterium]|nr:ankyrin repeat domain-containing protein [Acidobacteriota bacterium]HNJ39629.1 ankyrin repeat domain-containing protein [Acidobacteriota bacterium]